MKQYQKVGLKVEYKIKIKINSYERTARRQLGRLTKNQRIEQRKKEIGSKKDRKMKTYSNNFNEMFYFFLNSYHRGLLTFSGVDVVVIYDKDGYDAKETFRRFENGDFKLKPIITRHPNIVKGVIVGKKAWGLSLDQWTDGISEMCFTKSEILEEFDKINIKIPESLLKDFENRITKKFHKRYELKQFPFI